MPMRRVYYAVGAALIVSGLVHLVAWMSGIDPLLAGLTAAFGVAGTGAAGLLLLAGRFRGQVPERGSPR